MAKVIFTEIPETTDKLFCEALKRKAISDITPLVCPSDKEAFAHVSVGANGSLFEFKVIDGCCPKFQEMAATAIYRWAK